MFFRKKLENFPTKFKFFIPIVIGIIISISALTLLSINKSRHYLNDMIIKDLSLDVKMITKMFQRERALKFDKVKIKEIPTIKIQEFLENVVLWDFDNFVYYVEEFLENEVNV